MPTTLKDIARACGMNVSTVSRALRGDPRIKAATRERMAKLAAKMGYRPNLAARALVVGQSRVIWFLLPSLRATLEQTTAHHASVFLGEHDYDLLAALHRNDETTYQRHLSRLGQGMADGAIIIPHGGIDDGGLLRHLLRRSFPLVFVDRHPRALPEASRVVNDNAGAVRALLHRLHQAGARRVVSLFGDGNNAELARRDGLVKAAQQLGMPLVTGARITTLRTSRTPPPTAIMATSQSGIHDFLKEHPALVRQPLFFGCFDQWAGEPHPAQGVAVAKQDFAGMARAAVALLMDKLAGRPVARRTVIPPLPEEWITAHF